MLNRLALRLCTVFALEGKTYAGDKVCDSKITLIDPLEFPAENSPFIAVYTDDQSEQGLALTLEIGVSAGMAVFNEVTEKDELVAGIPETDAGIELVLDLIERQVHVALADENNEWAELFRVLFSVEGKPKSLRGASKTKEGDRYAGRQIVIEGQPLSDPEFGRSIAVDGFWSKFLAKADQEPRLQADLVAIRAALGADDGSEDWQLVRRAMRLSQGAADALGVTPAIGNEATPITGIETELDQ